MPAIDPHDLIATLLAWAHITLWTGSKSMGRKGPYLDSYIRRASVPSVTVAAELADVCGCDIIIRDRATGETVATIEPPAHPGSGGSGSAHGPGGQASGRPGATRH
jgi:hypothetical protein